MNPKRLAADAVQRLADSEPTEDSIEGMERLRGTPQESMFVVDATELQRVIECTLEDAIHDASAVKLAFDKANNSSPSSRSIKEALDAFRKNPFRSDRYAAIESLFRDLERDKERLRDDLRLSEKAAETWRIACDQNGSELSSLRSTSLTPEEAIQLRTATLLHSSGISEALRAKLRQIAAEVA